MFARILFFALVSSFSALGQTPNRLTIVPPDRDLGAVYNLDKPVKVDFLCRNETDAEIKIEKVVPGCGCTSFSMSKSSLKPKEEVPLELSIDLSGKRGRFEIGIALIVGKEKPQIITITGYATKSVSASPATTVLKAPAAKQEVSLFIDRTYDDWQVISATSSDPRILVEKSDKTPKLSDRSSVVEEIWSVRSASNAESTAEPRSSTISFRLQSSLNKLDAIFEHQVLLGSAESKKEFILVSNKGPWEQTVPLGEISSDVEIRSTTVRLKSQFTKDGKSFVTIGGEEAPKQREVATLIFTGQQGLRSELVLDICPL